jgi:hypothetical protein
VVECQLPKLDVAGSIPVSRSSSNQRKFPRGAMVYRDVSYLVLIHESSNFDTSSVAGPRWTSSK